MHGFAAEIKAPVTVLQGFVVGKLRRAAVGFVGLVDAGVNALVVLAAQHDVAVVGVAVEGEVALQIPVVVELEVGGEVFDVINVRDLLVAVVGVPLVVEVVLVRQAAAPAGVVRAFAVVGEQRAVECAFLFFAEEAVFSLSHEAAFGHGAQGKGGVLVWRDVPVVRNADFESTRFAAAQ